MSKSLTETYMTTRNSIDEKIVKLQALLKELDEEDWGHDWGCVGTAIYLDSQLEHVIETLEN